ncbi:hypothetical protein PHMEG_00039561 [Phytophthora megakarya]|uniref:Uncharacterized protein n=1 Tax=Phytophthora megakarya TaxID=4795 RepID=A0A225UFE0_9STRA|nr:hypothetical protein PHMEG_00039561 [Phytophthora megakarya]
MVQFRKDKSSLVDGAVKLPHDSFVHLVQSDPEENTDDNQNDWLDVIVPAYGQCRVPRESVGTVSPEDEKVTGKPMGEPLISLSLSLRSESDGLKGLLEQIGWSLQKLSLGFYREVDVNSMVPSILKSCPKMTQLALDESFIDLDRFSTVYEGSGSSDDETLPAISILKFQDYYGIGEGEGKLFMKRLGDPTTRLAKHLRELTIQAEEYADPLEHPTLAELSIALGKNTTLEKVEVLVSRTLGSAMMKRRLRQLDGQVLPPRPLPLSCKLAFLSVAQLKESGDMKTLPALQRLDQRVISLVFEFAATFVVRSIKVYG